MFSQFGEDTWILENLELPRKGTFVDVGAGDGVALSNTLAFEQLGWSGICIEPDPRTNAKLRRNRHCLICTSAIGTPDSGQFFLHRDPHLSGFGRGGRRIPVSLATLDDILTSYGMSDSIDLISIDVEGHELEAWSTLFVKPAIVIIEFRTIGLETRFVETRDRLITDGYRIQHVTASNIIASLIR